MKRLIVMLSIVAFLVALPLCHIAMAAPAEKVSICHVNHANDIVNGHWLAVFGKVIEVDENAVAAHLEHGDSTFYKEPTQELLDFLRELGYSLPNANCYFSIYVP